MTETMNGQMLQPHPKIEGFRIGDVVQFNKGQHVPTMTIMAINPQAQSAVCFWFNKDWTPCSCEFGVEFLDKVR